jgi:hypothetical protein
MNLETVIFGFFVLLTPEPSPWLEPTGGTSTSHPASASKRPVSAYDVER